MDDFLDSHFSTLTRRHIGAARTRETSPATISNCASYASSGFAAELDSGHHVNRPWKGAFAQANILAIVAEQTN